MFCLDLNFYIFYEFLNNLAQLFSLMSKMCHLKVSYSQVKWAQRDIPGQPSSILNRHIPQSGLLNNENGFPGIHF